MAVTSPESNLVSQAALASLLKYAPQKDALAALQQEAEDTYKAQVAGGESDARLGVSSVKAALPQVAGIYDRTQAQAGATRSNLATTLAALSPAASGFKAAAATEGAVGQERTGRERASALSDLNQQGVAAADSAGYTRTLAGSTLQKTLTKIFGESTKLGAEEGASTTSELDKLRTAGEKDALTERGQNLTRESAKEGHQDTVAHDNQTAAEKAAAKTESKPLTQKELDTAASTIAQIKQVIGKHGEGLTRAQRVQSLSEGSPEQTIKEGTESFKKPARPAYKPNAQMAAALDWAEFGHMTRNTEVRLQREGIDPSKVGVPRAPAVPKTVVGRTVQAIKAFG